MKKKILSLILCLSIIIPVFPVITAGAQSTDTPSLMAGNTYSEYLYISSVEELLALEGHEGGYYKLMNDLDLSGIDWQPITLSDAVFDGNGHYIYNMTAQGSEFYGLFKKGGDYSPNVYQKNVNLSDISVTLTATDGAVRAYPFGLSSHSEHCYLSGTMNIQTTNSTVVCTLANECDKSTVNLDVNVSGTGSSLTLYGMTNSSGSTFSGDITIQGDYDRLITYCLYKSDKCKLSGDIDIKTKGSHYSRLMSSCVDCEYDGDYSALASMVQPGTGGYINLYGLDQCSNCRAKGNFSFYTDEVDGYTFVINSCDSCTLEGDITMSGDGVLDDPRYTTLVWQKCIVKSSNCVINGNIKSYFPTTTSPITSMKVIEDSTGSTFNGDLDIYAAEAPTVECIGGTGCVFNGNVRADRADVTGISYGTDCTFNGNIHAGSGTLDGMFKSKNCIMRGNITAYASSGHGIWGDCENCALYGSYTVQSGAPYGIALSKNCRMYGSVTSNFTYSNSVYAMLGCTNCSVSGSVTATNDDGVTLSASGANPYIGLYELAYDTNYDGKDDYRDLRYSNIDEQRLKFNDFTYTRIFYVMYNASPHDDGEGGGGGSGEPIVIPTPKPISYTVRVIRDESEAPVEGATVSIDGEEYTTDKNGVAAVKDSQPDCVLRITKGNDVSYVDIHFEPTANSMNEVRVNEISVEKVDLGNEADEKAEGPYITINNKKMPVFSFDSSFSLTALEAGAIAYDAKKKSLKVIFGGSQEDISKIKGKGYTPRFVQRYTDAVNKLNQVKNKQISPAEFFKTNPPKQGAFGFKGYVSASGFMEIKEGNDGTHDVNGGIVVCMSTMSKAAVPIPAAPFIFVTYSIKGSVEAGLTITCERMDAVDSSFKAAGRVGLSVTPSVGVGLGANKLAAVEGGLSGTIRGDLTFPIESLEKSFTAKLSADYYFMLTVLMFDFKYSHTFWEYQLYPQKKSDATLAAVTENDLKPVSRDYLNNIEPLSADENALKTGLYPYSRVKIEKLSDGRVLVVWLDDDAARSDMNRTALFYKIRSADGTWSNTAQINNDGTADFGFDLKSDGNKAAVVWQNASSAMSDDITLSDMAKKTDISYCEFDGTSWGTPVNITHNNNKFDYNPALSFNTTSSRGIYVIWTENDSDSPIPGADTVSESIQRAKITNGAVETTETVFTNLPLVYNSAVGWGGVTACITDTDNDITTDGSTLKVSGVDKDYESENNLGALAYCDSRFLFTEGQNIMQEDVLTGEVYVSAETDTALDNAQIVTNGYTEKALFFEQSDGFKSTLYGMRCNMGAWTAPVPVSEYDAKLRSLGAYYEGGDDMGAAAVLANISMSEDISGSDNPHDADNDVTQSVSLDYRQLEAVENLTAEYITTDDALKQGKNAEFQVGITNRTMSDISHLNITLTGSKSGELFSGNVNAAIAAGDTNYATVNLKLPEDFTSQDITATIEGAEGEDISDNSVTAHFGGTDLSLEIDGSEAYSSKYIDVTVKNIGCDSAENAILTVTDGNGNEIARESAETIQSGKKNKYRIDIGNKNKEGTELIASVSFDGEDIDEENNSDIYVVSKPKPEMLYLDAYSANMTVGESYTPHLSADVNTDIDIYAVSSDENVAVVDADGKITAKSEGSAVISYMMPGAQNASKLMIYVRDNTEVVINSAEYTEGTTYNTMRIVTDTSQCLADGEKERMIIALYDDEGKLLQIYSTLVGNSESNYANFTVKEKPATIKAMIWNSVKAMKPAAVSAMTEIKEEE